MSALVFLEAIMFNTQAPEKRVTGDGTVLAVNSIFHTIQGEGPFAGTPAVFVRLAGCNLQCPMCDTEYTGRLELDIDEILQSVTGAIPYWPSGRPGVPCNGHDCDETLTWGEHGQSCARHGMKPVRAPTRLVVITGGEPFRQPIGRLIKLLQDNGYAVQVETNGTLFQPCVNYTRPGLTIVCSPKTSVVHRDLLPWIAAFKYVATADSIDPRDGLPTHALEHPNNGNLFRPPADWEGEVYLQPVDERNIQRNLRNRDAVVHACLEHGHRLCLQIHKDIGVP